MTGQSFYIGQSAINECFPCGKGVKEHVLKTWIDLTNITGKCCVPENDKCRFYTMD